MAFQQGSTIDPRLMQMDYSGFVNAANTRANAMVNIGQKIGGFITKFDENQQKKKEKAEFESAILPELMNMAGGDEEKAKGYAKMLANNPDAFKAVMEYKGIEREQENANMTLKVLNAVGSGALSAQEAIAMGVSPEAIKDYTGATEGQTAKQFTESVTLAAESVGGTYDPAQRGIVVDDSPFNPFGATKLIPLSDPMFEPYFATAQGRTMTGRGYQVMGTTNGDASRSEGAGQSTNVVTPPVTSAVLNNVAPVNTEGSRAGRFVGGIDDSVSSVINKGVSTAQQVGVNALASVPAGLQYLLSEDDPSFGSNFRISQSILSNLQPDFDLQRFPSREQVRAEALKRFQ